MHPAVALAGEPFCDLMADGQGRSKQDLFFERMLAADTSHLIDETETRRIDSVRPEGKKWLKGHAGTSLY
jgi:hypothetical protein